MDRQLFSIGHSNLPLDRLVGLLTQHGIEAIADIRRYPGSRKFPYLSRENLAAAFPQAGIEYQWMEALGGRRRATKDAGASPSPNLGLRNDALRNFADYMLTDEFRRAIAALLDLAEHKRTAMMCSEVVYWRCHRRLVSDFLQARGILVQHIFSDGKLRPHALTEGARIEPGRVSYPGVFPGEEQGI